MSSLHPQASSGPEADGERGPGRSLELDWALSLLAGFGGAWAGISLEVPGLGPALALLALLPLYWPRAGRGERGAATLLAFGWLLGLAGAHLGRALDASGPDPASTSASDPAPDARLLAAAWMAEPLGAWLSARDSRPSWPGSLLPSLVVLVAALPSRATRGLVGLGVAAVATGAIATVCGSRGAGALARVPPDLALDIVALALAAAGLGTAPKGPEDLHGSGLERRTVLALAGACALAALGLRGLAAAA